MSARAAELKWKMGRRFAAPAERSWKNRLLSRYAAWPAHAAGFWWTGAFPGCSVQRFAGGMHEGRDGRTAHDRENTSALFDSSLAILAERYGHK